MKHYILVILVSFAAGFITSCDKKQPAPIVIVAPTPTPTPSPTPELKKSPEVKKVKGAKA